MAIRVIFVTDPLRECQSFDEAKDLDDWRLVEISDREVEGLRTCKGLIHRHPNDKGIFLLQAQVGRAALLLVEVSAE